MQILLQHSLLTLCSPTLLHPIGDEEEVVVMGGEGFTPEQIAEAEADFERRLGINLTGACMEGVG